MSVDTNPPSFDFLSVFYMASSNNNSFYNANLSFSSSFFPKCVLILSWLILNSASGLANIRTSSTSTTTGTDLSFVNDSYMLTLLINPLNTFNAGCRPQSASAFKERSRTSTPPFKSDMESIFLSKLSRYFPATSYRILVTIDSIIFQCMP